MGLWQVGDGGYSDKYGYLVCTNAHSSRGHTVVELYAESIDHVVCYVDDDPNLLRYLSAIDNRNPERGLWGMLVDWGRSRIDKVALLMEIGYSGNPYLTLLKVLMVQEGIEDER